MKSRKIILFTVLLNLAITLNIISGEILGLKTKEIETNSSTWIYLKKAVGELKIDKASTEKTYELYFLIPISFQEQVPILIEIDSPHLIDYRFIHLNPPNVIAVARMKQASNTWLTWTAWILIKQNPYSDFPRHVPIPDLEQLPDSVKKWLEATDCVQISAPIVQNIAQTVRDTTSNLMVLAQNICDYCYNIPWEWPHLPFALDAVYALTWGSSCTGHAHAGVALFRANGIPARTLLSMPIGTQGLEMHWILQYFIPEYGWVRMETSTGQHPNYPSNQIITLACNPEDEFPLFFPSGIEGYWHSSDPALGMFSLNRNVAHSTFSIAAKRSTISETINLLHTLSDSVFIYYSNYWGIILTPTQDVHFQSALNYQASALFNLQSNDLAGYISNMQLALENYQKVKPAPLKTIYLNDFENDSQGWSHGGINDEWEVGTPTYGPLRGYSGDKCWGTDLDDTYENNADNWLISPLIDVNDYACAYLSFWVWNWVEDENQELVYDPLWLDITTDNGATFYPLCSYMGGVNDDPEIPDVGGWTMMVLDLTKYIGNSIQIRFRFQSNSNNVQQGSYIDDVHIYGRLLRETSVETKYISANPEKIDLSQNYPNPFNSTTKIQFGISVNSRVDISIYNIQGQKIRTLVDEIMKTGKHDINWNGSDNNGYIVSSGIYLYKMKMGNKNLMRKIMFIK